VMNLAGEAVGREPLGHRVSVEECTIDELRSGPDYPVKSNGVCRHDQLSSRGRPSECTTIEIGQNRHRGKRGFHGGDSRHRVAARGVPASASVGPKYMRLTPA